MQMRLGGRLRRRLMHRHHVGHRHLEQPVVGARDPLHRRQQRPAPGRRNVGQSGPVRARRHVDLVRPSRGLRDVGHDAALVEQDAAAGGELVPDQLAQEAATSVPAQLGRRHRWNERIGVDLPMWVMQCHPDLLTTVLEDEDVLDAAASGEFPVAIGPDLGQAVQLIGRQGCKGAIVLVGVDHHLAEPAGRRPGNHRRKSVLENGGLKACRGNLARVLGPGRAERAVGALR